MMKRIVCAALCVALIAGIALIGEPSHSQSLMVAGGTGFTMMAMVASFSNVDTLSNVPALLVGTREPVSRNITLLSGENRKRGAVLGILAAGGASSAAKSGGNTGNGTFVLDVSTPELINVAAGTYTLRFLTTTSIRLENTKGEVLGDTAIGGATGNTATINERIKGVVTQGATPFAAGDGFDITIAAGSGKYKLSAAAAIDGSGVPKVILAEDCDASLGDKVTVAYFAATVDENALTYGAGHTAATCREPLRDVGIDLQYSYA